MRAPSLVHASLVLPILALGCLEPDGYLWAEYASNPGPGPNGPAPDANVYECAVENGASCKPPRARIWLPDWQIYMLAARGNKAAFCGLRLPLDAQRVMYGGQIDLTTGRVDWAVPLGTDSNDFKSVYNAHITASGEVVFLGSGYGKLLVGEGGQGSDNITVAFDNKGSKVFAKRLEIWDAPPPIEYRPDFVGGATFSDDTIRIRTSFHHYPQDSPGLTILAAHIFSLNLDGTQTSRVELPHVHPTSFEGSQWNHDGSLWSWQAPGPMYHYAKDGTLLDTFVIDKPENLYVGVPRGFAPVGASSVLANVSSTKGATNEVYRYDAGAPRTLLFDEPRVDQFGAGEMRMSLNATTAYFVEQGYDAATYRMATIDAEGARGAVTKIKPAAYEFTLYDEGVVVFYRTQALGSEVIVQPL